MYQKQIPFQAKQPTIIVLKSRIGRVREKPSKVKFVHQNAAFESNTVPLLGKLQLAPSSGHPSAKPTMHIVAAVEVMMGFEICVYHPNKVILYVFCTLIVLTLDCVLFSCT
jgi:hypothetical protein